MRAGKGTSTSGRVQRPRAATCSHDWRGTLGTVTNPDDAAANFRSAIHIIAAYVIGDNAQFSWSKAEDATWQEQCRQKGRL